MASRAITSERRCDNQPSARSPATALHHDGFGEASHDWTGDCAKGANGDSMTPRNNATLSRARQGIFDPSSDQYLILSRKPVSSWLNSFGFSIMRK
jgi:hypothetical protein